MKLLSTDIPDVVLIEPNVFGDERGFFLETWHQARYVEAGVPERFVQDNLSRSRKGILRGLHMQHPHAQGKLVYVVEGEVFDVAVDLRLGSPTFGRWFGATLSSSNHRQMYVPPGFAHGFCVTSEHALFAYKCTERYHPETEVGLAWNDPELAIPWPIQAPELNAKDRSAPTLADIPRDRLPMYRPAR